MTTDTPTSNPGFLPRYSPTPGDFTTVPFGQTPSQTVGPYLHIGLPWSDGPDVVPPGAVGGIKVSFTLLDGAGKPITDALVETWQADAAGRFAHDDDPRGRAAPYPAGFRGFGRAVADETGVVVVHTIKPGTLPAEDGRTEAPHIDVGIFARGMLERLVTRMYFPDEADANAADPVLSTIPERRRSALIAEATPDGYHLHIVVQGDNGLETPFFLL
ncbi:protocatechuate 3,4-dioxygenase subunit alpha [Tsukamurella tyrosinosolvens]|uniref:protocatechuate 3,4-dioxygenase subunit alpha n=1 Tax=Tsukamurella tyrosinosolvens TaxID=57704 RepID=UPI001CE18890|nr:protocatechuate 3,4-dioxygenase subunit alpha [Tsukamurella tyrosinosolvens]MCA4997879.1 protocatechuate 3,4-dioxygenase subunit alpha [Tsukamurella tyrosinosolvens]